MKNTTIKIGWDLAGSLTVLKVKLNKKKELNYFKTQESIIRFLLQFYERNNENNKIKKTKL